MWEEHIKGIGNHNAGNSTAQHEKFKKAIQKFYKKYMGPSMIDKQKDAMENRLLCYEGTNHKQAVERLCQINQDIELLSNDADLLPIQDMARKLSQIISILWQDSSKSTEEVQSFWKRMESSIMYVRFWKSWMPNKKLNKCGSRKATGMMATSITAVHNQQGKAQCSAMRET